jgi:hypothetical protein
VGGFKAQELNSFGMDLMLTRGEQQALGLLPRKLTSEEVARLGDLCNATRCDLIRVYDGWALKGRAVTIGYDILIGKPMSTNDEREYFGTLAHEVMHTVQFTGLVSYLQAAHPYLPRPVAGDYATMTWAIGMFPSIVDNLRDKDIYSPSPGNFESQTFEQQGSIIGECFGYDRMCDRTPYQPGVH